MEIIGTAESPCDQHCARDASSADGTVLNVSSSACSELHGPTHGVAPGWLSVAVTTGCDVVVQTHPSSDVDGALSSSSLAAFHGVSVRSSTPHFARVSCANIHALHLVRTELLSLPLAAEDVLASDVSTRSTVVHAPPTADGTSSAQSRSTSPATAHAWSPMRAARCCAAGPAVSKTRSPHRLIHDAAPEGATTTPSASSPHHEAAQAVGKTKRTAAGKSEGAAVEAARALPTIALLLRSASCNKGRVLLLLLRPAVHPRPHHTCSLVYAASLWPVSESVRHVALHPSGDGVFALCDRFAHLSPATAAEVRTSSSGEDGDTHVVLHGRYAKIAEGREAASALAVSTFHVGLSGSSANQRRALRSVLRGAVSGVWCRCGPSGAAEVTMYGTEGHVLVFQPVHEGAAQGPTENSTVPENIADKSGRPAFLALEKALYTCSYGTRLPYAQLSGTAPSAFPDLGSASLLIAPPWRFIDQWRHSVWFRAALERGVGHAAGAGASLEEEEQQQQQRRRRHQPSTVLATSRNRRVWLVCAGAHLSLVTVPSPVHSDGNRGTSSTLHCCSPAVVKIGPQYTLHDAQFAQADGHAGFLLLCRHHSRGAAGGAGDADGGGDGGGAVLAGTTHAKEDQRYVHARPTSPVQLFFLSLLAMNASGADAQMPASLLAVPLQLSSAMHLAMAPLLFHPAHRLRFACAATASDVRAASSAGGSSAVYLTLSSSGCPRKLWTAAAYVPSLSSWCSTHLLRRMGDAHRGAEGGCGASCPLPVRVQQWVTHALSAAWPCGVLAEGRSREGMVPLQLGKKASPPSSSFKGSLLSLSATASLETLVEAALLHADSAHHDSDSHAGRPLDAVRDILQCVLRSFTGVLGEENDDAVAGEGVACVTAVFAGFSAALRMSGLLECVVSASEIAAVTEHHPMKDATKGQLSPTTRALVFLHSCAQLLRHTLEELCAVGHISALLACVSHLTHTVQLPTSCDAGAMRAVWGLLLQPLFDLVWVVLRDYGVAPDVTGDLLLYCSAALREMAKLGASWWPPSNAQRPTPLAIASTTAPPPLTEVESPAQGGGVAVAPKTEAVNAMDVHVHSAAPAPPTPPPAPSATAPAYTSAELFEVVRRVFLLQGAAAALRLVDQLRQHESTRDGVAEMASIYEAMQQRLDRITA